MNKTLQELRALMAEGKMNFLVEFSQACRDELVRTTSTALWARARVRLRRANSSRTIFCGMWRSVENLPSRGGRRRNMRSVTDRLVLGQMSEHLDAETAVQVVSDPALPWAPDDLGGQAPRDPRLAHDVVRQLPGAVEQPVALQGQTSVR